MSDIPSFNEDHISQVPALGLLINLGYEYVSPARAYRLRGQKLSNVILEDVLSQQLRRINEIEFRGKRYPFSNHNISNAVQAVKDMPFEGIIQTNEKVYDLISLGKSFEETIEGETRSWTLRYIDWQNFGNNVFHVSAEFPVAKGGTEQTRRPDIVLFVNGIPLAVIECKRQDIKNPLEQAISQHIGNQRQEQIPRLFIYSQLLLAIHPDGAKYGTAGTESKFWSVWKERTDIEQQVKKLINKPLDEKQRDELFKDPFRYCRNYFETMLQQGHRQATEQDRAIYCLCRPDRLLELTRGFVVFDEGEKKIARYQQYFAVKNAIRRVKKFDKNSKSRNGGVIWHTQGSGKSLTMVMLAKALALDEDILNPRIAVVTDRVNLDEQIWDTFRHCGKEPVRANTGRHLVNLIRQQKEAIITTVIAKFDSALSFTKVRDEGINIFVLVDESHRSQYGKTHAKMRKVFPNACYIGFTGTPLLRKDKNTAAKFGGFIDKYKIDQAVDDKMVVPLLYEGRHVVQNVDQRSIDEWFERVSKGLTDQQKGDLKKKFSRADHLNETDQKIFRTAYDISDHFVKNWQGTGFKAQLAAPSKKAALKYKKYLDDFGMVSSQVLISGPDEREDNEDIYERPTKDVRQFWDKMMKKYGDEAKYNQTVINRFKDEEHPEIIIVVSKLLTGFDSPRNTVLYLTKKLKEHNLLQAIARVNRLYEGKDYGYIVDYYGVLGDLNHALNEYQALEGFDREDIEGTVEDINAQVESLKDKHSAFWDIFKTVGNKMDIEEYEQLLGDEQLREQFYKRLSDFSRTLQIAFSTVKFITETSDEQIDRYRSDLEFFQKLRVSVKRRYSEEIDYREYENRIQKLIDTYIKSDEVLQITPLVDIFDKEKFEQEVSKIESPRARADTIANRTKRTITERWEDDPAFYKRFSQMLQDTISDFMAARLSDAEYLRRVTEIMHAVRNRTGDNVPDRLEQSDVAKAFYGIALETLHGDDQMSEADKNRDLATDIALAIDDIVQENLVVDWGDNPDIQNAILDRIEELLYQLKDQEKIGLGYSEIDELMERCLKVAKTRYPK